MQRRLLTIGQGGAGLLFPLGIGTAQSGSAAHPGENIKKPREACREVFWDLPLSSNASDV